MGARRITIDEYLEAERIKHVAFDTTRDMAAFEAEQAKQSDGIYKDMWAYFDDDGSMTARMRNIRYQVNYDGHVVKMGGIAGVSSLPEARGKGRVRDMFKAAFDDMRADGYLFTGLYPFSHPYYRQYGYENISQGREYFLPMAMLQPYARHFSQAKMHHVGDPIEDFAAVHDAHMAGYNMAIRRNEQQWRKLMGVNKEAVEDNDYRYMLYIDGKPMAYVLFRPEENPANIRELCLAVYDYGYDGLTGFEALMCFLYGFRAQFSTLRIDTPTDFDMCALVAEPKDVSCSITLHGQARIMDVQKALELLQHPNGEGAYSVQVDDAFMPDMSGTYEVAYKGSDVTVKRSDAAADMRCDIGTLSQLAVGYLDIDHALFKKEGIEVKNNIDTLCKVFVNKKVFMAEHF